MLPEVQIVKH